jgi:hypothetical protein
MSWQLMGEGDQTRLSVYLGACLRWKWLVKLRGAESPMAIHTRVLADVLSETSNGLKIGASDFKIGMVGSGAVCTRSESSC